MNALIHSLIFTLLVPSVVPLTYKYMEELCDSELDLDTYDSVRLKLTADSWSDRINCYFRVRTNSNNRMMFYFKSFSVSCGDGLYIRDGESSNSHFVPGDCDSDEYSCRNGRCISDNLVCNGNNPCGDYSDCAYVIAAGVIAGIVVGTVALVVTVVTVVVIICRRRRVAYAGRTVGRSLGSGSTSTTTLTQGYGQAYPKPYAQQASAYPAGQQYPDRPYPQY